MEIGETIYCATRDEWRAWLQENHATAKEIWLMLYKKASSTPSVSYEEAVEEALCFGWIDSVVQRVNDEYRAQKFSPRRAGSEWSLPNKQRVAKMIKAGRMTKAGRAKITYPHPERMPRTPSKPKPVVPDDLRQAIEASPTAKAKFAQVTDSTLRVFVGFVQDAIKPETRARRCKRVVEFIEQGRRPGMEDRL